MKTRVDSRIYTNMILTVIAVLLLTISLHEWKVSVIASANAQTSSIAPSSRGFGNQPEHPPVTSTNIPQVQDSGLAAATLEVANANRDIAAALREVAKSIDTAGTGVGAAMKAQSASTGASSASGASSAAPEAPTIEVGK